MNFYQLNSLMSGENPYELKPLDTEDMKRHILDPDLEQKVMDQQADIQDMKVSNGGGTNFKPLNKSFDVGVRPSYEFDKFGSPIHRSTT